MVLKNILFLGNEFSKFVIDFAKVFCLTQCFRYSSPGTECGLKFGKSGKLCFIWEQSDTAGQILSAQTFSCAKAARPQFKNKIIIKYPSIKRKYDFNLSSLFPQTLLLAERENGGSC